MRPKNLTIKHLVVGRNEIESNENRKLGLEISDKKLRKMLERIERKLLTVR